MSERAWEVLAKDRADQMYRIATERDTAIIERDALRDQLARARELLARWASRYPEPGGAFGRPIDDTLALLAEQDAPPACECNAEHQGPCPKHDAPPAPRCKCPQEIAEHGHFYECPARPAPPPARKPGEDCPSCGRGPKDSRRKKGHGTWAHAPDCPARQR